jgi:hypothetical protein
MAGQEERKSILEPAGVWKGGDIDVVFSQIMRERERSASRGGEV